MPDYLYLIHPLRDGFFEQPTPEETAVMEEHFDYLKRASEEGIVRLAGPCLDDTFGLIILRAEDEAAARAFMFADPSVSKNVMMAELHPLHIAIQAE